MMKRSVCIIAYANYYTDARIKNYVEALVKSGYAVDIFALGRLGGENQEGVRVFSIMNKYWGGNAIAYALSQLWFALVAMVLVSWYFFLKRYCLIHVHNIPNFLVFSAIVPKLFGSKIILDVHDPMPESFATKFDLEPNHPLIVFLKLEERLSAWFADQVITTNELHKVVLATHGVPPQKIEIILNVGNDRIFFPSTNRQKNDGLTLVYHGTVAERLGLDIILEAMEICKKECPDLVFLLIGEGDYLPPIRRLVRELSLENRVKILGFIPVERLPEYISRADVGIVGNKRYTEEKHNFMLPVKMLEYAAMEIPTIAPRLKAITHYFDESSALFYEPDNAKDMAKCISDVYQEREIICNIKQKLKLFNQKYNWPAMERKYLEIVTALSVG